MTPGNATMERKIYLLRTLPVNDLYTALSYISSTSIPFQIPDPKYPRETISFGLEIIIGELSRRYDKRFLGDVEAHDIWNELESETKDSLCESKILWDSMLPENRTYLAEKIARDEMRIEILKELRSSELNRLINRMQEHIDRLEIKSCDTSKDMTEISETRGGDQ